MLRPQRFQGVLRENRQRQQAGGKNASMHPRLHSGREETSKQMRVKVSKQEQHLKEKQANGPDCCDSSKPGQDGFADEWLYLKEKKRAQENRHRIQELQVRTEMCLICGRWHYVFRDHWFLCEFGV